MDPFYPHRQEDIETPVEVHTIQKAAFMSSNPRAEIPTLALYTWDNGLAKIRRHIHETTNQDYKIHDLDMDHQKETRTGQHGLRSKEKERMVSWDHPQR